MISDRTGELYGIAEFPEISPDRKRFIAASASDAYNEDGVFILRFEGGQLVSELTKKPQEYALYSFVAWKDNSTILLSKDTHSDGKLCPESNGMVVPVTLKLEEDGWIFHEDLSPDAVRCHQ
ncbi:MAG: hypothetical protein V3W31_07415 [Thermodesulfobacteriota bacterium]